MALPVLSMEAWAANNAGALVKVSSVGDSFTKARDAYAAGNDALAAQILLSIIKKYPGHKPSYQLLGRLAYRAGNMKRAAQYFERAGPEMLDEAVALEWGLSFYSIKDCRRALPGLERVPGETESKAIARFYAASCYMKAGDLDKAEWAITKATNLPAQLAASRREILADLRKRRQAQMRGQMPKYTPYIMAPPPAIAAPGYGAVSPLAPPPKTKEAAEAKKAAPKPEAPPTKVGLSFSGTPTVSAFMSNTKQEYGGYKIANQSERKFSQSLGLQARYDGWQRAGGGHPSFTFDVTPSAWQDYLKGDSVEYQIYAGSENSIVAKESTTPEAYSQEVDVELKPGASLPLTSSISLDVSYAYDNYYVDNNTDKMVGDRTIKGTLSGDAGSFSVNGSATQYTYVDKQETPLSAYIEGGAGVTVNGDASTFTSSVTYRNNEPVKPAPAPLGTWDTVISGTGSWERKFELGSATVSGGLTNRTPPDKEMLTDTLLGAPSEKYGELGVTLSLPISLKLSGSGRYTMRDGLLYKNEVTDSAGTKTSTYPSFGAKDIKGVGSATLSPLDWLSFKGEFTYITSSYTVSDPKAEQAVILANPDKTQTWKVTISVTKSF